MLDAISNALVTNIISNVFHVIWFVCITIEPKYSGKRTVFTLAGAGVFCQILMLWLRYTDILGGMIFLAGYSLTTIIFGAVYIFGVSASHPAKSVFLMSAYYCLWTFIYSVISIITDSFAGAGNVMIWLLRVGLNLLFLFLYQSFFKKRILRVYRDIRHGDGSIAILSVLTFYTLTLLLHYNEDRHGFSAFHLWMMISVYVFVLIVYVVLFRFMGRLSHERQLEQMQFHEKLIREQMNSYEKLEQSIRQTRHDFRHHIIVVAEFAQNRDYQGILDYLQEYEKKEAEKYTKAFCANHAVDHVLSAYVARAEQKGIKVKPDIRLMDTSGISNFDLVSILANIMENAINGCMQAEGERQMRISIRQKGKKLVIVCKNTCVSDVLFENGIPVNKNRDSVGVQSILQSVEKYSGNADFSVGGGVFTCQVILSNKIIAKHTQKSADGSSDIENNNGL